MDYICKSNNCELFGDKDKCKHGVPHKLSKIHSINMCTLHCECDPNNEGCKKVI